MIARNIIVIFTLLFMVIFFFRLRRNILNGSISHKDQIIFWSLFVGILLLYTPYLTDYIFLNDGTLNHLIRIGSLAKTSFWFLSLPAILVRAGFSLMNAYKLFTFLSLIATVALIFTAFHRCSKNQFFSLSVTLLCVLNPLYLNCLYCRGDFIFLTVYPFLFFIFTVLYRFFRKYSPFLRKRTHLLTPVLRLPTDSYRLIIYIITGISITLTIFQSNRLLFELPPFRCSSLLELTASPIEAPSPLIDLPLPAALLFLLFSYYRSYLLPRKQTTASERS